MLLPPLRRLGVMICMLTWLLVSKMKCVLQRVNLTGHIANQNPSERNFCDSSSVSDSSILDADQVW